MFYRNNLESCLPPTASLLAQLEVIDIRYVINPIGKIDISMNTRNEAYAEYNRRLTQIRPCKAEYIDTNEIRSGDIFDLYIDNVEGLFYEYWILKLRVSSVQGVSTTQDPTHCPVCNSPLNFEEDGLYCFNSICPAKIKMTIRKFLFYATRHRTNYSDYKILDQLITQQVIMTPLDLYAITAMDLYSVGCRFDVAEQIIKLINDTIGNVTLSTYLLSLNLNISDFVPMGTGPMTVLGISEEVLDRSFTSVKAFLDWVNFIISTPGQVPEPYMNEQTFIALNTYLSVPENVAVMYQLEAMGLFLFP